MADDNDWTKWSMYVLKELERQDRERIRLEERSMSDDSAIYKTMGEKLEKLEKEIVERVTKLEDSVKKDHDLLTQIDVRTGIIGAGATALVLLARFVLQSAGIPLP